MKVGASETLQYLGTAGLLFVLVVCDFEHTCTPDDYTRAVHRHGSCGPALDEIIRLICSFGAFKRNDNNRISGDGPNDLNAYIPQSGALTQQLPTKKRFSNEDSYAQAKAFQFLRWRRTPYYDQNIVCECCYHHCSTNELQQYC